MGSIRFVVNEALYTKVKLKLNRILSRSVKTEDDEREETDAGL